jgi:hypothetical protein
MVAGVGNLVLSVGGLADAAGLRVRVASYRCSWW